MPRKKKLMYGDMAKELADIRERMAGERERMARIMCEGLLTGEAAEALGYCSDADLRKIMGYVAKDMGKYVARLEDEKAARARAREAREAKAVQAASVDGPPEDVFGAFTAACFGTCGPGSETDHMA